eukprot:2979042-Amphidinium_carterae.2
MTHTPECRSRLVECMEKEEAGRERLERAAGLSQTLPLEEGRVDRENHEANEIFRELMEAKTTLGRNNIIPCCYLSASASAYSCSK